MGNEKRTAGFLQDRFGMFIHFGLYSIPARGEWVQSYERIGEEEYRKYFEQFNPVDYRPAEWAKLARESGMKYAVLTAKHHDGFCLFDSQFTDFKSTNTPIGRDLIREYVEAFRAEGIRVGFYYSLLDWHHPDYPAYHDKQHPMRDNEEFNGIPQDFSRYVEYFHNQVKELLTNYGKIDLMWFDFSYEDSVNDMSGEKWGASELIRMIRSLQPDIILNDRMGGHTGSIHPTLQYGDFVSPEQYLPKYGMTDANGTSIPWEACVTLNDHWGYCAGDRNYKQPKDVIRALTECVSKNGNLILNVGPDAKGNIPEPAAAVLQQVGKWLRKNGDSIYRCKAAKREKPEWGRFTQNGKKLYAHVYERGIGPIFLEGMAGQIRSARLLSDGSEVNIETPWNQPDNHDDAFLNLGPGCLPDESDTVIEIDLAE
jgi:alpha-L-fucosidase